MEPKVQWCGVLQKNCPGKEKCEYKLCDLLNSIGKFRLSHPHGEIVLKWSGRGRTT